MASRYSGIVLVIGMILIAIAVYFFLAAITLISPPNYSVVASLLSAIVGFLMLSTGSSLIKTYVITKTAEKTEPEMKQ
jgi:protein-S-isoprenylcysteine O-methyltransferase Ste14